MDTSFVEEAITEYAGPRCDEYMEGCCVCEMWKKYDALRAALKGESERNQA